MRYPRSVLLMAQIKKFNFGTRPFKCYVTQWEWGCTDQLRLALRRCTVQRDYRYEGLVAVKFATKKRYVTLQWPL